MNQYEIELRDKYFETGFDALSGSGLPLDDKISSANEFADKCMAERQKHLDAAKKAKAQRDGYAAHGGQETHVCEICGTREGKEHNYYCINMTPKVQGTECER